MQVVTIATDLDNEFLNQLLIPSCQAVGLDLVILRSDRKEFRPRDKRLILTRYLLDRGGLDDLIVFTDAYDTLFIRGEQDIRDRYAGLAHSIVFSAEPNSWPLGAIGIALQQDPPTGTFPYLNSGGFMGSAADLLALCMRYEKPPSDGFPLLRKLRDFGYDTDERFAFSDQYYWTLVRHLEPGTVGLDSDAVIFENYGPKVPDVWDLGVIRGIFDFRTEGRQALSYQQERIRLTARLQAPSAAAQLHFSNPIAKSVVLDLFREGLLPDWITAVCRSRVPNRAGVTIEQVPA